MPAYLAGIEAHLEGYLRYVKIAAGVIEKKGMLLLKEKAIPYVRRMAVEGAVEAGNEVTRVGARAAFETGGRGLAQGAVGAVVPWVGLLSGADLVMNVVGHAATNCQLIQLRSQMNSVSEGMNFLCEKIDDTNQRMVDMQRTVGDLDEKMTSQFAIVKLGLDGLSATIGVVPDLVENRILKLAIQELRNTMDHINSNLMSHYKSRPEIIFGDVNILASKSVSVRNIAEELLTTNRFDDINGVERSELAHSAISAFCEAAMMELNVLLYEVLLRKEGALGGRETVAQIFENVCTKLDILKPKCCQLVGQWILLYGAVRDCNKALGAELSLLYRRFHAIQLHPDTQTVTLHIPNGLHWKLR